MNHTSINCIVEKFLCNTTQVEAGTGLQVILQGYPPLAVFHLNNGEFHVTADTCTHGNASLADGELEGEEVECPFHAGSFNVKTGAACSAPCHIPLRIYPSVVENGQVFLLE